MWSFLSRNQAIGQLLLRVLLGCFLIYVEGWEKLAGGMAKWRDVGATFKVVGIHFWPAFWGFLATMAETLGMVLFVIGFAFRPACLFIALWMCVVAAALHHGRGGWDTASEAVELAIVFLTMMFIGPGKYSVDKQ